MHNTKKKSIKNDEEWKGERKKIAQKPGQDQTINIRLEIYKKRKKTMHTNTQIKSVDNENWWKWIDRWTEDLDQTIKICCGPSLFFVCCILFISFRLCDVEEQKKK